MLDQSTNILAAGGTGGRNELKFFESGVYFDEESEQASQNNYLHGQFKETYAITEFEGGVQTMDFAHKSNKVAVGTAKGLVASFKLKLNYGN